MYDREAAAEYAHKWAYKRNPEYYDFDGLGGDCTNFISQVLAAGGAKQNYSQDGWYFNSLSDRSPSWSGVDELYNFLVSEHTIGPKAVEIDIGDSTSQGVVEAASFGANPQVMVNGMYYDMAKIKAIYN